MEAVVVARPFERHLFATPMQAEPGDGTHRAAGTKPVIGGCIPAGDGHEISENHPSLADGLSAAAHPAGRIVRPSRLIVGPAKRVRKTATRLGSNSCSFGIDVVGSEKAKCGELNKPSHLGPDRPHRAHAAISDQHAECQITAVN